MMQSWEMTIQARRLRKPIRESQAWDAPRNPFSAFLHVRALDCGPSDIVRVCFLDRVMSVIFVGVVEGRPVHVLRMGRKAVPDGEWKVGVREIGILHLVFCLEDNGMKTAKVSRYGGRTWILYPCLRGGAHYDCLHFQEGKLVRCQNTIST